MATRKRTVPVAEVAAARGLTLITPPADTVSRFGRGERSVWLDLYAWLISEHGAADVSTLDVRTYVGDATMRLLNQANEARSARLGHELLDLDDYPRTTVINGRFQRLTGEGLFVLPPKCRHLLKRREQVTCPSCGVRP